MQDCCRPSWSSRDIAPIASRGYLQDTANWPDFDVPATAFESDTTLYYYACNGAASGFSKCRVSDVDPTIATPSAVKSCGAI